jgi:MFS transporter, ACS family, pantothenate transporter
VLLIGAGTSSYDISRELADISRHTYQSSRGGKYDLPPSVLPKNATRIGEIVQFEIDDTPEQSLNLAKDEPFPLKIHLKSGKTLCNIDCIIVCTGYHVTIPFLSQYHQDETPAKDADGEVLVTDGTQMHNLHKDIWYMRDPSLAFVGVPYNSANFSLFEFQAMAVAAVLSGRAKLPSEEDMRSEYQKRVEEKGFGKPFHALNLTDDEYANDLLDWLNRDGAALGLPPIPGHTQEWHEARKEFMERKKVLLAGLGRGGPFEEGPIPAC